MAQDVMEVWLWLLPSVRFCRAVPRPRGPGLELINPTCQPPQAGSRGPLVIAKENAANSELSVASVQGPSIPSLLGTLGQGAMFPSAKHPNLTELLYDRHCEICKDLTHS